MVAVRAALILLLGISFPRGARPQAERCLIVDAIMDGRTASDHREGRQAFKQQSCVAENIRVRGRYRVKAVELADDGSQRALLRPGEVCSAGYEGVRRRRRPGAQAYVQIEVRPGGSARELKYSAGLRIERIDSDGTVSEIGMGCGGFEEGLIRKIDGSWRPVDGDDGVPVD